MANDMRHPGTPAPLNYRRPSTFSAAYLGCGRTLLGLLAVLSAVLLAAGNARAQGTVATDRAALVALYNATGGANWTNNTNWLSNEALSEWHGVTTDVSGRVTHLALGQNGLTGTIPPELENLVNLQVFDVRNTGLSCVTPGSQLHTWLTTINSQGAVCATRPPGGGGGGGGPRTSAPGSPRNLTAAGGNGEVVLSWEASARDGGAAITDYEYRINRRNPWISIGSTDTTHTVTGLVNGTAYVFEVRAVNRIGKSFSSNRAEATPEAPEVFALDFAHFANGTSITSDLVLVNVAPQPVRPAIYFYDTEGAPIAAESVLEVTADLEITEDGGLTVRTEMEPLGVLTISTHGRGELVSGSARVVSDGPIGGGLRYNFPAIGEAVVGASPPVRDVLFPVRRQEGGIRTAAALHNLGEEAIGVNCRLLSGGVALEEVEIPLEANGQSSWFIEDAFTTTDTSDFLGSVRCTVLGSRRFTAIAVEMDAAQRIFNTLSVVPVNRGRAEATTLDFAHFVNATWITDLVFVNLETQPSGPPRSPFHTAIPPSRPAIYFYDTEGNLIDPALVVDVTGDLEITEDGALTVQTEMEPLGVLTISTHGRGALVSGSVRVVSEGPIGGMLRFEHPDFGVAGVGASPPLSDALFPVRRQEGGINTGVALHNLESSPGLLRCDLMREGVLLDAVSIPLEANGQTSWLLDQSFPAADTSDFVGSVRCDAVGEGLFSAVALEMDPGSTHGRGALVSGSVRVVSEGPIGGMLRFEHPDFGVAGVGASPPLSDALFPVRRQEGGINTGVALHNLESSPGLLRCDLMREGVLLDAVSIPLEANGQTSWLLDQSFPAADTSDFVGSVRCDAVGEGLFSAVALKMDPGTRIFTTLPVVPVQRAADDVRSIEDRSDDDDKGGDKGDDDDDDGVGSRLICVGNVRDVQTTVPAAAANYTVAYDRFLTPGCAAYVDNRYFGKDVPWISYSSAANAGRLITYTVEANPSATSARTGNIWIIDIGNNNTPVGRTTITQERAQYAPTVELSCARCDDVLPNGEPIDLIVTASDGNGDEDILPNWEWSKVDANGSNAGVWSFGPSGRQWGPPDGVGRYTIGVTVTDTTGRTASDSVNIDVAIFCGAFVSGILTDEGDGTGFLSTAERGFLHFKLEEGSHASCPVTVSSFRSTETWVRGLSAAASTRVGWDRVIEFEVDANPTSVVRSADVWLELKAPYIEAFPSERITLQQAGRAVGPVTPQCPSYPITDRSTSWSVGDRYYGSGFTQPWAKMGYGTPGGCRVNGLSLSQPGRVRICGYNVADADARGACVAAPRAAAATHSTDPTAGAVTYVTSSGDYTTTATGNTAAAQWVEFLVDEKPPTGGTLSLAVGTSSGGVYLHFGYEHESDLSYGDSDYERWNVGTPTWTFSPAASTTLGSAVTHPTLTEHGRYPGVFLVTCAASNGRPTGSDTNADTDDGFSVRVSAAQGSPSVSYTASAAHPTYPRICKP